ncbi:hypothetical protein P43SY_011055 [Pythium insidiosum]|uniref:Chromo domain-containing protein n=1 Tax=Pythium insidiosum TaxID=114742 RepID=A0AAD5L800_PYTIN|nr:hypothetical protein P43SY_011055 [Pythium insidiosum]
MERRRDKANEHRTDVVDEFTPGVKVWLYINQVRPGVSKKLAHLWHGPFRVLEQVDRHLVRLEADNATYKFFPMVHTSRLKLWREFSGRPTEELVDPGMARLDFDEALLPEDSFDPDESRGEFEVEKVIDHRDRRLTRQGRPIREYLVRWVGYDEPSWVPATDLNAAGFLDDYEQELRARGRFEMMATENQ